MGKCLLLQGLSRYFAAFRFPGVTNDCKLIVNGDDEQPLAFLHGTDCNMVRLVAKDMRTGTRSPFQLLRAARGWWRVRDGRPVGGDAEVEPSQPPACGAATGKHLPRLRGDRRHRREEGTGPRTDVPVDRGSARGARRGPRVLQREPRRDDPAACPRDGRNPGRDAPRPRWAAQSPPPGHHWEPGGFVTVTLVAEACGRDSTAMRWPWPCSTRDDPRCPRRPPGCHAAQRSRPARATPEVSFKYSLTPPQLRAVSEAARFSHSRSAPPASIVRMRFSHRTPLQQIVDPRPQIANLLRDVGGAT